MTDQPTPRSSRRTTAIIVVVLVAVIAAVTVIALLASGTGAPGATTQSPNAAPTVPSAAASSPLATATPAAPSGTPKPVPSTAAPTPQATRTATISKPTAVPIKKALTATVVKMEAVTGTADGPGEIAGPSVRFTIRITNTTGKPFSLADTVVNAYSGTTSSPAVQLRSPGGRDFPSSVRNGASATGVFVFNIPKASRSRVEVTVDTSVQNPVIAFKGAAPTR